MSLLSTLYALFRADPARFAALSVAPTVLAGAQGLIAYVHGLASPLVVLFVAGLLLFAAGSTSHSLARHRVESLEVDRFENSP